ncbi:MULTISPECIES: T9SS type A sorting domain-containing protein [Arenibacter]|uniref:T9SS type A sorting domain-containing protein n=1 Tax=Arenibacter TaxID=178469 RepID=UPI000A395D7C|nr:MULTISPECIES: T9SS type A sorting domain-containing protein [Arenibacter]
MKRKLLLILLLIWNFNSIFGQICGTPPPTTPIIYPQEDNNTKGKESNSYKSSSSYTCINVFFHIVRNTNGTNAFPLPDTNDITVELNEFYSPHNIIINNIGTNFIDNSDFIQVDEGEHTVLMNSGYDVPNAINYYIVEELWDVYINGVYQGFVTGVADSIPSNSLVIRSDRVLLPTSHHELGHCLNLYHTFQGTAPNTSGCAEAINGSNCSTCGDVVCDTPADSNAGNSGGYTPDLTNIMSYYNNRDHFTNGQGNRMRYAIQNESVLQNITANSCPSLNGPNTICSPSNSTFTLQNGGTPVTWQVSSNLLVVSSNDTSITVKPKYSSGSIGQITANLSSGAGLTTEVQINNPSLTNSEVFVRDSNYNNLTGSGTSLDPYLICDGEEYVINMYSNYVNSINYTTIPSGWTSYSYGIYEIAFTPNNMNYGNTYAIDIDYTGICSNGVHTIYFKKDNYCFGGYFTVSPNPSSETLNIEFKNPNQANTTFSETELKSNYKLYDFHSNLVLQGNLDKQKNSINVSSLRKGMYILKIYIGENVETHQIIIN